MIKFLLHMEGLAVFIMATLLYGYTGVGWWMFFLLLLAPDLAMLGYLRNKKVGAYVYNVFHTYSLPFVLVIIGFLLSMKLVLALGLIWTAHIGMDRVFGFGLKYPDDFKSTHFEKV